MGRVRRDEKGTALVEFALTLPILAMLAMGTVDLGRVYQTYSTVKNAARAGALYAQAHPGAGANAGDCADPGNIIWQAQHEGLNTTGLAITITDVTTGTPVNTCDATTIFSGHQIKVTATKANFAIITPLISAMMGSLNVSSSVTVRAL